MENLQDLVKKARALEAGGQHAPALDAYHRALSVSPPETETNLRARVGLLQLRLGQLNEGAAMLEGAVSRYVDAGLYNNAIALCQRVLGVDASRFSFLRQFGELCLRQGYAEEARKQFATHAAALEAAGDTNGAVQSRDAYEQIFPPRAASPTAATAAPAPPPPSTAPDELPEYGKDASLGLLGNLPEDGGSVPAELPPLVDKAFPETLADDGYGLLEGLETTHSGGWDASGSTDFGDSLQLQGNIPIDDTAPPTDPDPEPLPLLSAQPGLPDALSAEDPPEAGQGQPLAVDEADAASQFDLAIAFQEMGLWDDAITHLERALEGGFNPIASLELLGRSYVEKGEAERAIAALDRASQLSRASGTELVGVHYWLGRAREASGAPDEARMSYEKVVAVDPGYRDAATRLEGLASG